LQKLSNELEQLPRVVPRYSLVDAILPQLERLSEAKDGPAGIIGTAGPTGPANPAGPSNPDDPADRSDRSETARRTPERSRRLARDLWPRLATVAAFGVLIGVWLVNAPLAGPGPAVRDTEAARSAPATPDPASSEEAAGAVQRAR
jgi:hypothetical protein